MINPWRKDPRGVKTGEDEARARAREEKEGHWRFFLGAYSRTVGSTAFSFQVQAPCKNDGAQTVALKLTFTEIMVESYAEADEWLAARALLSTCLDFMFSYVGIAN